MVPSAALYRQAVAVRAELVSDFPSVPLYRVGLAKSYAELALGLSQIRRVREAEQNFRDPRPAQAARCPCSPSRRIQ